MLTVEFVKQNIRELKKLLEHTQDRALKAYYQGQLYAFELVLRGMTRNPDYQEENEYTKVFDKMLTNGGKLEGAE